MPLPSSRLTQLVIDLGDEQVAIERIDCIESLSTPFLLSLDVVAPLEIDILPHLGKAAKIRILDGSEVLRHFNGYVTASEYRKESGAGHHYRLTLRPWTYFLDQNRDYSIYNEADAVDIIKQVLTEVGVSDIDYAKLSKGRTKRVYCTQYGESDFAFISRLMEEEGIYYFFDHGSEKHRMILCEGPNAHVPGKPASLYYSPSSETVISTDASGHNQARFYLQEWAERVATTGEAKVTMRDYDFEKPDVLDAPSEGKSAHPLDKQEVYLHPGRYVDKKAGADLGKVVLDAARAERRVFTGFSHAVGISVGQKVRVTNHPVARMNREYLVISTHHSIASEVYRATHAASEALFDVRFEAIPSDTIWQAPRRTPKPVVHGMESAVITGPKGETIYTDEYGRVKVRFHWDRHGRDGEKTTCWMRVSQTGGLGNIILPRVGHEVLVDFLNGDPDRPLVVGRVFNRANMPIYDLPANKTRALWRTKTYGESGQYPDTKALDTGAPGVNELRFEDKGGKEEIFIHAERDMNLRIRFDHTQHIGHNQDEMVGFDRKAYVGRDETMFVKRDQATKVGQNQKNHIVSNRESKIDSADEVKVGTDRKLDAGKTIVYSAGTSIELKVGSTSIKLDNTGITMTGSIVKVSGDAQVAVAAPLTKVNASGMLILSGTMTKIN